MNELHVLKVLRIYAERKLAALVACLPSSCAELSPSKSFDLFTVLTLKQIKCTRLPQTRTVRRVIEEGMFVVLGVEGHEALYPGQPRRAAMNTMAAPLLSAGAVVRLF